MRQHPEMGARLLEQSEGRDEVPRVDVPWDTVDPSSARLALEDRGEDLVEIALGRACGERATSELERGYEEPLPGKSPAAKVGLDKAGDEAGNRDGRLADVEDLRGGADEVDLDLLHLAGVARGDGEEAVEQRGARTWLVEQREAATRRPRERPFRNERRERRGDRRVDRRAALAERPGTGLGRVRIPCCDRATHAKSVERRPVRCL